MVPIPSGNFMAGKPDSLKSVFLETYHIDRHEVTQEAFERRMGKNPAFFKGANRPVEDVTWFDANKYCRKAGKRLPTEWEWEKAAKAGSATPYYWGADMDGRYAWYKGNSEKQTHPVGEKKPNRYGLYDMAGNVWEWTSSNFGAMGKVVRGGSWRNSPVSLRSAHRIPSLPIHKFHYVGFRCVQ
ncbi:MAG: formylglycine-generating enzyme family protein [Nitrospinaceae bacterium]